MRRVVCLCGTEHRFLCAVGTMVGVWCVLLVGLVAGVTEEEYTKFPRLYHIDDYRSCLAHAHGLFCMGTFQLLPEKEPDPLYSSMKEYSKDLHNFNRLELHRGYCVSSRCPAPATFTEQNVTLRFDHCVSQWARRRSLRTRITKLYYCTTHAQQYSIDTHGKEPINTSQKVFLSAVAILVLMNIIGTVYDVFTCDASKKHGVLTAWSIPHNWARLTAINVLSPMQGIRVLLMLLIILSHSTCIQLMLYLYNPRWIEEASRHPALMLFFNGTSIVQVFIVLSNFLLAYNLMLLAKTRRLTLRLLPYIILKRIVRISPVHLLIVGFAATWWADINSGPMWTASLGVESEVCRRKFWAHAFYINNLVQADDKCLTPTWFLAVDVQLYVMAAALTIALIPLRRRALPLLAALLFASCLLNGALAYIFEWKSLMYFSYPGPIHTMYHGIPSFSHYYQAPWGSLPACLVGLFLAHVQFELQEAGVKVASYKSLRFMYDLAPLAIIAWFMAGNWLRLLTMPWFVATYAALERPVLAVLSGFLLLGVVNGFEGWLRNFFGWRGWNALARLSLPVLMLHWVLNMTLAAMRLQPIGSSVLSVMSDFLATSCFSYLVAVPVTLLVEMPVQRTLNALIH